MAQANQMVVTGTYNVTCWCGEASINITHNECKGDSLYFCQQCTSEQDAPNAYCEECGVFCHRRNNRGHAFDIESDQVLSVQAVLESKEDEDQASWGLKLVSLLIGVERWNQIAPYVKTTSIVGATTISGVVLYSELTAHFAVIAKETGKAIAKEGAKEIGKEAGKEIAKYATKNVIKMGGVVMIVASLAELAWNGYRWASGEISGKEWFRLAGKTLVRNAAALGGMAIGAKLGAAAGTMFCPGVGTAVGFISGIVLGCLAGKFSEDLYETYFPDDEEKARKNALDEALKYFHFQEDDIKNRQNSKFNETELKKRFKTFALIAHPDKNGGDHTEWHILSAHYGILRGLCQSKPADKEMIQQVLAITN